MSSFTHHLDLEKLSEGVYRTKRHFSYYINNKINTITVPSGYTTDCATIPKPFSYFLKKDDIKWAQAAVLHDWLYEHFGFIGWKILTRKEIDKIFLHGMKLLGASFIIRILFYYGVRAIGWTGFKDHFKVGNKVRILIGGPRFNYGQIGEIISKSIWNDSERYVNIRLDDGTDHAISILNLEMYTV